MRKEDHEHIAQCCVSLQGLVETDALPQRVFTPDEFHRFIDRLVWAINASPGGQMNDDQKEKLTQDIVDVLKSCARVSDPTEIIAGRLLDLFVRTNNKLEDAPLDFKPFVDKCAGSVLK